MTEIPEHLLKRSRARKGGSTESDAKPEAQESATTAAADSSPAGPPALIAAAAMIPADKPAPEPAPKPAHVAASEKRRRIPIWAMPVVAALPIWAWAFAGTMQQPEREDPLLSEAASLYTDKGCSGCHGAAGGGGTGYQLSGGEVIATFPSVIDQLVHVARGSDPIRGETYGDPARSEGVRTAGDLGQMPSQAEAGLTQLELELVVYHERAILSGEDTSSEAYSIYIDNLRERIESGDEEPIDLDHLLSCANPDMTPEASGSAPAQDCTGPDAIEALLAADT